VSRIQERQGRTRGDECRGDIPLELLDFVVDTKKQQLIGNPDHGGEFMIDMFSGCIEPY